MLYRLDLLHVRAGMHQLDLLARRRLAFDEPGKALEQPGQALGVLGVNMASGRMQLRQRRMADQLDV